MTLDFSSAKVMGILNITPDSFSEVGRYEKISDALRHVEKIITEGAAIIDVGGEPSNPKIHSGISLSEELDRVIPVIEAIKKNFNVLVSVDTSKAEVMQSAIKAGADMINDIRALSDPAALQVVAVSNIAVCLMHMAYPLSANLATPYDYGIDTVTHIRDFLEKRINACVAAGIKPENIVIDPGFGAGSFGKNLSQNIELLRRLGEISDLGYPLMVGLSRKTFIGEILKLSVSDRLYGSIAAAVLAVCHGAKIIRTHDVKPTVEAITLAQVVLQSGKI